MSPRARLIANPVSGTDTVPSHLQRINEALRGPFGAMEIVLTVGDGDAERAARQAVEDGCEVLFVAGGDGTLNETINGAASAGRGLSGVTFGIIPLGTGNDVARVLGIPLELDGALGAMAAGRTLSIDLGSVNDRLFANTSSGGFIAEVSDAATPQLKSIAGRLAWVIGGAQALMEFDPVPVTVHAEPGRVRFDKGMYAYAVCNSPLMGGGRLIAPRAAVDDGLLDLCFIESMSSLDFVGLLRRVSEGSHVEDPRVHYVQASSLVLDFGREMKINTDGEVLVASRCRYGVLPGAARFFAGPSTFADKA